MESKMQEYFENTYKEYAKLSIWLCQIAKNTWFNHLKKQKRELPILKLDSDNIVQDEYLIEWIDVIERLEEPYRSVFIERVLKEDDYTWL